MLTNPVHLDDKTLALYRKCSAGGAYSAYGTGEKYPNDTLINTLYLPQTHAADDLIHRRPEQALRDLESMGAYNLISQQEYLRGLAYLDLKDGAA